MSWTLRRAASLVAVAAMAVFAAPTHAQATGSTAPGASQDAAETAAPRRRPVRRNARVRYTPDTRVGRDTITVPIHTVSSRPAMRPMAAPAVASPMVANARRESVLRDAAPNWIGIPYRWGGTTRRGIDCSAFVQQYVRATLGVELARNTAGQRYQGTVIDRSQLRSGDLVFFRRRGVRHVGVYLSDGEFIHASSSRGVTISNLNTSSYWNRHYWMSRRIVSDPSGRMPTPRSQARRDSSSARG